MSEILDAFLWGFQLLEVIWEQKDGLILPERVVGKPPAWFRFDGTNNLRFITRDDVNGIELPERKFLLAQHHAS